MRKSPSEGSVGMPRFESAYAMRSVRSSEDEKTNTSCLPCTRETTRSNTASLPVPA